ncbi:MAG: DUF4358 domain-containing protein [Cellulosilyticaceae bacterium]
MKKFAAILMIAVASTAALVGCSGGDKPQVEAGSGDNQAVEKAPLADLLNAMIEAGAVRMPMPVDETLAQEAYQIDLETVEEYAIAETGISPGPGLVVMAKAKEGQVDAVKANMEALLEAKVGNAFYPDEQEAAKNAEVMVDGNYVALFIINDEVKEDIIKLFEE